MATIPTSIEEKIYQIKKWLGVNEAQEGEASLDIGEAAVMRNFKVTSGGALQKRGGSKNIAGLMSGYTVEVDTGTNKVLLTEQQESTATLSMYPNIEVDSVGNITFTGEPVQVTAVNQENYVGYYYKANDGLIYRFAGVTT